MIEAVPAPLARAASMKSSARTCVVAVYELYTGALKRALNSREILC